MTNFLFSSEKQNKLTDYLTLAITEYNTGIKKSKYLDLFLKGKLDDFYKNQVNEIMLQVNYGAFILGLFWGSVLL